MSELDKETEVVDASTTEDQDDKKTPSIKRKQRQITIGVIAAIVVVVGAGLLVWHEQPSFCNAICHTPMDPYLPTYEAEPGQASIDKWGNTVQNASGMMAAVHRVSADSNCLDCHVPTIGEQVTEGIHWITGDYDVAVTDKFDGVLFERELEDLTAARGAESDTFCLNDGCHNMTRDDLAETTSYMTRNVHVAEHDKVECGECHKAHRASVVYCSKCHDDATIPEGWISVTEESALLS